MGISIWQLLIVLVIVLLLFGTKKLKNIGGDLGGALKSFKGAMSEGKNEVDKVADQLKNDSESVIEGEVASKEQDRA